MKKVLSVFLALLMLCFTACGQDSWHPETTEVVFDTQQLTVEKVYPATDLGSGTMDYYKVTATATGESEPYYNITMSALVGVKYYPGQYPNIRDARYSGYLVEEIRDMETSGSGDNMQWKPYGDIGVFTDIPAGDTAVLWGNGRYETEHNKEIKNISHYLPGMFFNYKTTVKEYFRTEGVSVFVKLYVEEIVSCTPQQYHLQIACTDGGAAFG